MTLRFRLFLVYLIGVLLTAAIVGAALFELWHSRRIVAELQRWNRIVLGVQKLTTAFERDALLWLVAGEAPPTAENRDFPSLLVETRSTLLADAQDNVEFGEIGNRIRWLLNKTSERYSAWRDLVSALDPKKLTDKQKESLASQTDEVRYYLNELTKNLELAQASVMLKSEEQTSRTMALLGVVCVLMALHVVTVGWLLRRWLLAPMSRLNRQVEALARDAPPDEPLLTSPQEMASLAGALDRARESLGEMRRQLIESERMTTLGRFAAQLAHNLRNPLASIRAVAQVAARHNPNDGYIRDQMQEIVASVDRLNRWIAGLMEVVRREPTATRVADVLPVLHRVREAMKPELATKEIALDLEIPADGLVCPHEPDTIEHALVAMVVNAIEASPMGSRVTLRAERVDAADGQHGSCRISVVDRGTGLPADDPERIFDSSFSTKQRGMGLGLALARLTLERQGGTAHARNNPDGGATVYIELPIPPPAP
jgi:signal transduction histidine kinase